MTQSIKAATVQPGGGIESLQWSDHALRDPGPNEVRIAVRAASLNFRDIIIARGVYPLAHQNRIVALSDGAGVVEAVGASVRRWKVGDRVTANFMRDWVSGPLGPVAQASSLGGEVDGMLAESVVLPEHALVRIPDHLSFVEAATYPCAGVTAWNALLVASTLKPGDTLLVQGTGGVSIFALQIARLSGARVIATSGSNEKIERLKSLGAEHVINYRTTPDWAEEVLRYTGGRGVDHTLDVGGTDTLAPALRATTVGGTVSVIGILTGAEAKLSLAPILFRQLSVNGLFVGSRQMLEDMLKAAIRPVVDHTFRFDKAQDAYRYLESGKHFGKVVLAV